MISIIRISIDYDGFNWIKINRILAGEPGFEPRLPGPEPGVLPLNYSPICNNVLNHTFFKDFVNVIHIIIRSTN